MADIPSPLTYGTIVGNFITISADSNDVGNAPDIFPISGEVSIVPSVRIIRITGGTPQLAVAQSITARIVNGVLYGPDGSTGLRLLATDSPGINPASFQYTASFQLSNVSEQPNPVIFNLPGGETVNLASVVSIAPSPAIQTVVSEDDRIAAEAAAASAEYWAGVAQSAGGADLSLYALLNSPAFTGNPTAPTQTSTDSSTRLANTAFIKGLIIDEDNMASNLATRIPTQQSVKAYVDGLFATANSQFDELFSRVGGFSVVAPNGSGGWGSWNRANSTYTGSVRTSAAEIRMTTSTDAVTGTAAPKYAGRDLWFSHPSQV